MRRAHADASAEAIGSTKLAKNIAEMHRRGVFFWCADVYAVQHRQHRLMSRTHIGFAVRFFPILLCFADQKSRSISPMSSAPPSTAHPKKPHNICGQSTSTHHEEISEIAIDLTAPVRTDFADATFIRGRPIRLEDAARNKAGRGHDKTILRLAN